MVIQHWDTIYVNGQELKDCDATSVEMKMSYDYYHPVRTTYIVQVGTCYPHGFACSVELTLGDSMLACKRNELLYWHHNEFAYGQQGVYRVTTPKPDAPVQAPPRRKRKRGMRKLSQ